MRITEKHLRSIIRSVISESNLRSKKPDYLVKKVFTGIGTPDFYVEVSGIINDKDVEDIARLSRKDEGKIVKEEEVPKKESYKSEQELKPEQYKQINIHNAINLMTADGFRDERIAKYLGLAEEEFKNIKEKIEFNNEIKSIFIEFPENLGFNKKEQILKYLDYFLNK